MNFSMERKRTRGEIACVECRRSKARCDKLVPCSTCVKRGCGMLCPNSAMPPGEGSRFVAAAEEFLRQRILKMEERMRLLEDALVIIQGTGSCKPYPLLSLGEGYSATETRPPEVNQNRSVDNEFEKYGLADVLDSLYLSGMSPSDGPAHFGTPGSSENLLRQAKAFVTESSSPANHAEELDFSYFPPEICVLHQKFPFTPPGTPTEPAQDLIESYLPSYPRATALCETFLHSTSWIFTIVSRQYILGELIPMVYGHSSRQTPTRPRSYGPHDLALIFAVFAIGALVDPSLPPHNVEGQHYYVLSRAALCLQSVFSQRSVATIKALNLMSIYNGMCGIESKMELSFALLNLAAHVALQTGFHKDPLAWGITGREAYERQIYFWNLLNGTLWQSLISGRPPVIVSSMIACSMPTEEDEGLYQSGETSIKGFGVWCLGFTVECLIPVVEVTQGARSPSYDTVLALDCKIREFSMPQVPSGGQVPGYMQDLLRSQLREITLLFLHRGFFARALADFPSDPLKSPLRQSVLFAYQSATGVLSVTRKQFAYQPVMCARMWRIWSFAFSAAVIIATVAIKQFDLEPEPLEQLDLACTLFQEAATCMSVRAQKALPMLLCLRQQATQIRIEALRAELENVDPPAMSGGSSSMPHTKAPSPVFINYAQALPLSIVHLPPAEITECDEEHYERTIGFRAPVSPGPRGLSREISSSTSLMSHGLSGALYVTHPFAQEGASENLWTSTMHNNMRSQPP